MECRDCLGFGKVIIDRVEHNNPYSEDPDAGSAVCDGCEGTGRVPDNRSALARAVEKARGGPPPTEMRKFA